MYIVLFSELCEVLVWCVQGGDVHCLPFDNGALMITLRMLDGAWK